MAADPLNVRLLGRVTVQRGEQPIAVNGAHRLAMLSMLALRAGEFVSSPELAKGIWDEEPPARAPHALHVYISELRKALGGAAIETQRGGYRLCIDRERVDALLFEDMVERVNGGPPDGAVAALVDALSLWRGPALDGAADTGTLRAAAARLEEERLMALERRFTAELALGEHAKIVGELVSLVAAMPLRESFRAQLMLAQYRSGRQADALATYRAGRAELAQLGLNPGDALRDLEQAILRQDPTLTAPAVEDESIRSIEWFDDEKLQSVVAFAESWASDVRNFDAAALAALADRAEELASAFRHSLETGAKEAGARLLTATWFYWIIRGRQQEADAWAQAILALPGDLPAEWELEAQMAAGELAGVNGDFDRAARLKRLARETAETRDVPEILAGLDADLARLSIRLGDLDLADAYAQRALELRRANPNDMCGVGHALAAVGEVHEARGDLLGAIAAYDEAIADYEDAGFTGEAAFIRGRLLGRAHRACGNTRAAYAAYRRALNEARAAGDYGTTAAALQGLAWVATVQGDTRGAARLLAAASREEWQRALEPDERARFREDVASLRRRVPEPVFSESWRIGTEASRPQA